MGKLRRESSQLMRAAIDGEGDLPAIILAIRTAGFDPWQFIDGSADKEPPPFPRPPRTAAEYRMTMALRHLRRSPVEVKAATLPILDPSLAAELLRHRAGRPGRGRCAWASARKMSRCSNSCRKFPRKDRRKR
ncbi:hypothetical protein AJ88_15560 [Mesorhizobium amorphae CCBAU 01583]|nr:hypothetical protein AJ88_15560 [Mesorhizobium amorphae CCBAU 01583]